MLEQLRAVVSLVSRIGQPDFEMVDSLKMLRSSLFADEESHCLQFFWSCILEISSSRICWIYHEMWVCI